MEKLQDIILKVQQKRPQKINGPGKPTVGDDIKSLEVYGVYKRFSRTTFESIERRGLPQDEDIRKNYSIVKDYAAHLDENLQNGIGMILAGNYGTLKSTMAVAVLRKQIDNGHGGGLFVPMCSLIDNLFTMRSLNREEWAKYEQRIRNTPLLVLDDLGSESTDQSWVLSKVDSIITERYNKMRPIIVTTNLTANEIEGTYSGRLMDRLKSTSKYVTFTGKSQRKVIRE